MFLKRKIAASSIAEVVIAVAVIALCFGVASLVFVRSTMVSVNFQNIRLQTEIQSMLWENLYNTTSPTDMDDVQINEENDEENDSLKMFTFLGSDDKILWKQHWLKND